MVEFTEVQTNETQGEENHFVILTLSSRGLIFYKKKNLKVDYASEFEITGAVKRATNAT